MADKHLTENLKGNYFSSERKDMKFLKGFTLVALLYSGSVVKTQI